MPDNADCVVPDCPRCGGELVHAQQRLNADTVRPWDHGCTTLRFYGPKGWRCIECFTKYVVGFPEADHSDGSPS